jgi:hypothetical protein
LYVGSAYALLLLVRFRLRPTSFVLWAHGLMMLVMVPFGYHLVAHGGIARTITGLLFGFGLTYYLALNPAAQLGLFDKPRKSFVYWPALLLFIFLVLFAVERHSHVVAWLLAPAAFAGLVVYLILLTANAILLPLAFWRLVRGTLPGRAA